MKNKIAAFVDASGNVLPIHEEGKIQVYEIRDSSWYCIDEFSFGIGKLTDIAEARRQIHLIAPRLDGCNAIVVHQCKGLLHAIFEEELRLRVFLATGNPIAVLFQVRDIIRKQIVQAIERIDQKNKNLNLIFPVYEREMCFRVDLVEKEKVESFDCQLDILNFLREEAFVELEIITAKEPRGWLFDTLQTCRLVLTTELRRDGWYHAFVSHQN